MNCFLDVEPRRYANTCCPCSTNWPSCQAGYDHLQLARSIGAYFVDIQERLGGRGAIRVWFRCWPAYWN